MGDIFRCIGHGFSMAIADSMPGVSGGTIAFILGFYERFLGAIKDIFSKNREARREAFVYLFKFAIGWAVGMSSCVLIISQSFEKNVYFMSSLFTGFIVVAIPIIVMEEKKCIMGRWKNLFFTLVGICIVVMPSMLKQAGDNEGFNYLQLDISQYIYLFFIGMIVISAMLLPGISGSTLLLIFGVYAPTIDAIKEILHLNFAYLPGILVLGVGVIFGLIGASDIIKKALKDYRSQMVYLILGLLVGSIYAVAIGPTTLKEPKPSMNLDTFSIVGFFVGIVILFILEYIKIKNKKAEK